MPKRPPVHHSDHIEILLTQGYSTIVDLDCPEEILEKNWCALVQRKSVYAVRSSSQVYLHRAILGLTDPTIQVDHRNGDSLNNMRANLRPCTQRQNLANQGANTGSTSRFRGVSWDRRQRCWVAQVGYWDGQQSGRVWAGHFDDEATAAQAWDKAALESGLYDPEFLRLNFPNVSTP